MMIVVLVSRNVSKLNGIYKVVLWERERERRDNHVSGGTGMIGGDENDEEFVCETITF